MPWYMQMKGADELNKNIQELIKGVDPDKIEPILGEAAKQIADDARSKAPVKTGALRRSIVDKVLERKGDKPAPAIAGINYGIAPHAHLVEFSHGGIHPAPAHPFFRPAWDQNRERLTQEIPEKIKKAIEDQI